MYHGLGSASGYSQLGKNPKVTEAFCLCRDIFFQGFGPFRWVCISRDPQDLTITDQLATSVLEEAVAGGGEAVELEILESRWPPKSPIASLPDNARQTSPLSPLLILCLTHVSRGAHGFQFMPINQKCF